MNDLRTAAQQQAEPDRRDLQAAGIHAAPCARHCEAKAFEIEIRSLKSALGQQQAEPVQEPVAWMVYTEDGKSVCVTDNPADFADEHRALPLYTAPPQRLPLTDEEIDKAVAQERDALLDHIYEYGTLAEGVLERIRRLARAVERKVRGEKE